MSYNPYTTYGDGNNNNNNNNNSADNNTTSSNTSRGGPLGMMGNILNRSSGASAAPASAPSPPPSASTSARPSSSHGHRQHGHRVTSRSGGRYVQGHSPQSTSTQQQQEHHYQQAQPSQHQQQCSQAQLTAETVAAMPPPGLSGPAPFSFSPPCEDDIDFNANANNNNNKGKGSGGRYLSFLSSVHTENSGATATAADGKSNSGSSGGNVGERRLCVVDMAPLTLHLMKQEAEYRASSLGSLLQSSARTSARRCPPTPEQTPGNRKFWSDNNTADDNERDDAPPSSPPDFPHPSDFNIPILPTPSSLPITDPSVLLRNYVFPLLRTENNSNSRTAAMRRHHHNHHHIEGETESTISLEERLRRERQRLHSSGVTQFSWSSYEKKKTKKTTKTSCSSNGLQKNVSSFGLRILVPLRGNVYIQDGVQIQQPFQRKSHNGSVKNESSSSSYLKIVYDKSMLDSAIKGRFHIPSSSSSSTTSTTKSTTDKKRRSSKNTSSSNTGSSGSVVGRDAGAIDPQLSPDGTMVAFVVAGEIYVMPCPTSFDDDEEEEKEENEMFEEAAAVEEYMDIDDGRTGGGDESTGGGGGGTGQYYHPTRCSLPVRLTYGAMTEESVADHESFSSSSLDDSNTTTVEDVNRTGGEQPNKWRKHGRSITHGLADFVAQEEMDRYRGFWWDTNSSGILFARVDESMVPPYRITHQGRDGGSGDESTYEDHRYPFAGEKNPEVKLGYVKIDRRTLLGEKGVHSGGLNDNADEKDGSRNQDDDATMMSPSKTKTSRFFDGKQPSDTTTSAASNSSPVAMASAAARSNWSKVRWFNPPPDASEYLARVSWLPDGTACAQWQNRAQTTLQLIRMDIHTGDASVLHTEQSDVWINLHHMMRVLPRPVHPDECAVGGSGGISSSTPALPDGSFSFLFASERTGFCHLYLYTYIAGSTSGATLVRQISGGEWMVESIAGVNMENDVVYVTGTFDSPLERHLYALPLTNRAVLQAQEASMSLSAIEFDGDQSGMDSSVVMSEEGSGSGTGGVRRGLKQVMDTLSGGSSRSYRGGGGGRRDDVPSSSSGHEQYSDLDQMYDLGPPDPVRLTIDPGMHNVIMDSACRVVVDTSSDLGRPTSSRVYALPIGGPFRQFPSTEQNNGKGEDLNSRKGMQHFEKASRVGLKLLFILYDAAYDEKMASSSTTSTSNQYTMSSGNIISNGALAQSSSFVFPAPEILSFPTSDGTETLHAALYRPDPAVHGPGPYPLVCAVYGGPHVQRVNRSWSQCADMRAQRLCSLGFAVVKCDNRGSSRRGLVFEGAIRRRLGRLEVLDQVAAVRQLAMRGIADPTRVGIYGWSYGGYLAAMCLCRAPDVFHVAVAGAPVTSWDGYDTHYTERYMGLPPENQSGYRESAVFDHVPNMRGKLMIVHGLIDENVHFRHTARLINRLIAAGKDYDLLIFPDERHSPRRLRDRVYMEKRISDYFVRNLLGEIAVGARGTATNQNGFSDCNSGNSSGTVRPMAGHL